MWLGYVLASLGWPIGILCRIVCKGVFNEGRLGTCAHEWILFSQKGVSLLNVWFTRVYGCVGVGQPSSSVVIGIEEGRMEDSSSPDHVSGPPRGEEVRN